MSTFRVREAGQRRDAAAEIEVLRYPEQADAEKIRVVGCGDLVFWCFVVGTRRDWSSGVISPQNLVLMANEVRKCKQVRQRGERECYFCVLGKQLDWREVIEKRVAE